MNPLIPFLSRQGVLILDGGLATELEAQGADLGDALWSARLLMDDPELIRRVHRRYLEAGADSITSASYQATIPGFCARGLDEEKAADLLRRAVTLAREARDTFWRDGGSGDGGSHPGRLRPLVAASVGPYGAYLANGSEYSGAYDLEEAELVDFHRQRFAILAASGADLLACETIPARSEARALARLLAASPQTFAWLSFSCSDGAHLHDGSEVTATVAEVSAMAGPGLVAVGVNCTAPQWIPDLIAAVRRATEKPVVVYPNAGEPYDAQSKAWRALAAPIDFGTASQTWRAAGAALIGGCCRTGPQDIRRIRGQLL